MKIITFFFLSIFVLTININCERIPWEEEDTTEEENDNSSSSSTSTGTTGSTTIATSSAKCSTGTTLPDAETIELHTSPEGAPYEITAIILHPDEAEAHFGLAKSNAKANPESLATLDEYITWQIGRLNTLYEKAGINQTIKVVHHQTIDFCHIQEDWKDDFLKAYMNVERIPLSASQQSMIDLMYGLRDAYKADIIIYWRGFGDSNIVNGAVEINASATTAMAQYTYYGFTSLITLAHEIGHLQGGEHDTGYEIEQLTFIQDGVSVTEPLRTLMSITETRTSDDLPPTVIHAFSSATEGSLLGDFPCTMRVKVETGGHYEKDTICTFTELLSIGDADHNVRKAINDSSLKFSQFN